MSSHTAEKPAKRRQFFPHEGLDGFQELPLLFNTRWKVRVGERPVEMVNEMYPLHPYNDMFGEDYITKLTELYAWSEGEDTLARQILNDWLVNDAEHCALDFIDPEKHDYVKDFTQQWVAVNRPEVAAVSFYRHVLDGIKEKLKSLYKIVNTERIVTMAIDLTYGGDVCMGLVSFEGNGINVKARLTESKRFWDKITDLDVAQLNSRGYEVTRPKENGKVGPHITAALRQFDMERLLLTNSTRVSREISEEHVAETLIALGIPGTLFTLTTTPIKDTEIKNELLQEAQTLVA